MRASELLSKEYNPYYKPYITAIGDLELISGLRGGLSSMEELLTTIPEGKWNYSYAEGKWSIAEIILHLIDAERVFQYRALRFAREDKTELRGFDQDDYVKTGRANLMGIDQLHHEFSTLRKSTIALFASFGNEQLLQEGVANGSPMTVRALGFVICGHQKHHLRIIKERYLD